MEAEIKNTNGYILAGGNSARMGEDKGLMLIEGKAMVQYVIEKMQPLFSNLFIVSNNPEYEKFGLEVIPDLIKNIGPAGGIYTALNHSDAKFNFIVSCDMPFITKEAIVYICRNTDESQIVLPVHQEKFEPLFGIYAKDCLKIWLELIEQKNIKLMEMAKHFKLKTIPVENNNIFKESIFKNINTKEDFKNIFNLI